MAEYIAGDSNAAMCASLTGSDLRIVNLEDGTRYGNVTIPEVIGPKHLALYNGERVFVAHFGIGILCYDVGTGARLWHHEGTEGIRRIAVDTFRGIVLIMGAEFGVKLIDISSGMIVEHFQDWEFALCSANGIWQVGIDTTGLKIRSSEQERLLSAEVLPVLSGTFFRDCLMVSNLKGMSSFDLSKGRLRWFREHQTERVIRLSLHQDEEAVIGIATGTDGERMNIVSIDPASGVSVVKFEILYSSAYCFCDNGKYLVTADGRVFTIQSGNLLAVDVFNEKRS